MATGTPFGIHGQGTPFRSALIAPLTEVFIHTVGETSWTIPDSVKGKFIFVDIQSGGSGGAGGHTTGGGGGGGGAGACLLNYPLYIPSDADSLTITVGDGGTGGAIGVRGNPGGVSSITVVGSAETIVIPSPIQPSQAAAEQAQPGGAVDGGNGGASGFSNSGTYVQGGVASNGTNSILLGLCLESGGSGGAGGSTAATGFGGGSSFPHSGSPGSGISSGGGGGSSQFGHGAFGGANGVAGDNVDVVNDSSYGAGGGGGGRNAAGGNGGQGCVKIRYYEKGYNVVRLTRSAISLVNIPPFTNYYISATGGGNGGAGGHTDATGGGGGGGGASNTLVRQEFVSGSGGSSIAPSNIGAGGAGGAAGANGAFGTTTLLAIQDRYSINYHAAIVSGDEATFGGAANGGNGGPGAAVGGGISPDGGVGGVGATAGTVGGLMLFRNRLIVTGGGGGGGASSSGLAGAGGACDTLNVAANGTKAGGGGGNNIFGIGGAGGSITDAHPIGYNATGYGAGGGGGASGSAGGNGSDGVVFIEWFD